MASADIVWNQQTTTIDNSHCKDYMSVLTVFGILFSKTTTFDHIYWFFFQNFWKIIMWLLKVCEKPESSQTISLNVEHMCICVLNVLNSSTLYHFCISMYLYASFKSLLCSGCNIESYFCFFVKTYQWSGSKTIPVLLDTMQCIFLFFMFQNSVLRIFFFKFKRSRNEF